MSYDPNDSNRRTDAVPPVDPAERKTVVTETYVEPVERKASPLPLIIGILLALALAYFVLQRFMGTSDTVVVEEPAVITTPTDTTSIDTTAADATTTEPVVVAPTETETPVDTTPEITATDEATTSGAAGVSPAAETVPGTDAAVVEPAPAASDAASDGAEVTTITVPLETADPATQAN